MNAIQKLTLKNTFKLNYLYIVVEMEADLKASSKADAIIVRNGNTVPPITEGFAADFSMLDINIDASIFLGINVETLRALKLGSLLYLKKIAPCLVSAVDVAQLLGLSVTVGDMVPPKLSGFTNGSLKQVISAGAAALFNMYEGVAKPFPDGCAGYCSNIYIVYSPKSASAFPMPRYPIGPQPDHHTASLLQLEHA